MPNTGTAPCKATLAAQAIKAAWGAVNEVCSPIAISIDSGRMMVHLASMRGLDAIPGELVCKSRESVDFPWRFSKEHDGVIFFAVERAGEE